ncbi:MAG: putative toxin-antitoxin system toxin component, PIN family [Chitinispirillaceae bacterium]|nr:putative toxin-antitoxin system toxin component, PIN family [Chitinispirillaceae bacterium]
MEKYNQEELRVVIDTNVFISYLWGSKNAATIMEFLFEGKIRSVISDAMIAELSMVGRRGKFKNRFSHEILNDLCNAYHDVSTVVHPQKILKAVSDPKDNMFIECAMEAQADYIISGDQHLLEIGNYQGIPIVTPAVFLKMVM